MLLPILVIFLISACSTAPSKIIIEQPSELLICKLPLDMPYPPNVHWLPVKFYVINKEIMQQIILGNSEYPEVVFAMDANGYENLSMNMLQITNYLEANQELHKKIKQYYQK